MKLKDVKRPDGVPTKEFFRTLRRQGLITQIQLRAMAFALDKGASEKEVLQMVDNGKLPAEFAKTRDTEARENLPKLSAAPSGIGPKQTLLWLRDHGSLSPAQVRAAAQALDRGADIENALAEAGVEHLLDRVPPPVEKIVETPPPPTEEETEKVVETDRDTEEEQNVSPDDTNVPVPGTLGEVLAKNIPEIKGIVSKMENPKAILQLLGDEVDGKNRNGAVNVLIDRATSLGATEQEIRLAIERPERGPATPRALAEDLQRE